MPVASYQSPNDYNLVKEIRPFDLPYAATMQEIATKQGYWRVGAERIKSAYDQAVGLDPQFTQNREYLKKFMEDANKNLGKITKSDLSVLDNSHEATNVFKPLYDVTNPFNLRLLKDSQINKFYQKQQQLSDTYRTKDGGKEWNQNNDFYFRDAQQKYQQDAQNGNLDSIDSHFQNKKGYIPYYDYKKEILDIQEACKGFSTQKKSVAGNNDLYFQEESSKGCSPEQLSLAFKTGLSDRAKQQMQIDGYTYFKGNEDELAKQFADVSVNRAKQQVDAIKATIAGIKDGGVSKDETTRLAFYEDQLAKLEPELKQNMEDFNAMTKGNVLEYVRQNYDKLSGQVHFNNLTNQLAVAYRTDEEKNMVSANPAGMLRLRLETDRTNMYIQDNFDKQNDYLQHGYRLSEIDAKAEADKELARLKGELKGGASGTLGIPQTVDPVTGKNVDIKTVTENDFVKSNLIPAKQKATTTYNVVNDLVKKQLGKTGQDLNDQEIVNYITELEGKKNNGDIISQEGQNILEAYDRYKTAKNDLAFVNDQIGAADAIVKDKRKDLFDNSQFSDAVTLNNYTMKLGDGDITIYNPDPLTEKDVARILSGEEVKGFTYQNPTGKNLPTEEGIKYILYQGEPIVFDPKNTKLHDFFRKVAIKKADANQEISKLKTEFFTDQNYINSKLTIFNKMDFGDKPTDFDNQYGEKIKQYFHITGGLNDKNGYEVVGRDKFGSGAYIRLLDEDGKPVRLSEKTFAKVRFSDKGSRISEDNNTQSYYIPDMFPRYGGLPDNQTLDKYNKVEQHIRNIEKSLETNLAFNNAITMDTRELPVGGTTRYVSDSGIEYIISLYKEQGQPIQYVATYSIPSTGEEEKYKASSMDQLLPKLR